MINIARISKDEYLCEYEETLKQCDSKCEPYCKKYLSKYMSMKYSGDCYWLTFSPKSYDAEPYDLYTHHINNYIIDLCKVGKLICISEYESERLHFHIVIEVHDYIKYNKLVGKMSSDYQTRSYQGTPKGGIHYLFKGVDEAIKRLKEVENVINTEETLKRIKADKKARKLIERAQERMKRSQEKHKRMEVSIPKWMTKGDEASDEASEEIY